MTGASQIAKVEGVNVRSDRVASDKEMSTMAETITTDTQTQPEHPTAYKETPASFSTLAANCAGCNSTYLSTFYLTLLRCSIEEMRFITRMKRTIIGTVLVVLALGLLIVLALRLLIVGPNRTLGARNNNPAPALHTSVAYLLDNDTNTPLLEMNGETRYPMASTTKIMTALIALQQADLNQPVVVNQDAVDEVKNNMGSSAQLARGDTLTMHDMLYGLLLPRETTRQ